MDRAAGRKPVAVDLFAGAGGATLGLRRAGFEVPVAVEIDREKATTLQHNNRGTTVLGVDGGGDVRTLDGSAILNAGALAVGDVDLLVACPPCQGFSYLGRRNPNDSRNGLFRDAVRLTLDMSPTVVVFENVPGILSLEGGVVIRELRSSLEEAGYVTAVWDLNAAEYGVPQLRRRIFIVAVDAGSPPQPPAPLQGPHVKVWEAISDLPETRRRTRPPRTRPLEYVRPPRSRYATRLRGNRGNVANCEVSIHTPALKKRFSDLGWGAKDSPTHHRRLDPNEPAPTITAGTRSRTACRPVHPFKDRVLTVREAARLAGFPDWYQFPAPIAEAWEEIGNCVPPPLAAQVFAQVRETSITGRRRLWETERGPTASRYVRPGTTFWTERRLRIVTRRLSNRYKDPRHYNKDDPLDELIFILLSAQTTETSYLKTFEALKARFPTWTDALSSGSGEIGAVIAPGGLSNKKGAQILRLLKTVCVSRGEVSLDFLRTMQTADVERFLETLPGVGRKSAKCVAMYSLKRSSFPVDTHVRRVLSRLGVARIGRLDDRAQDALERVVCPDLRFKLHVNGIALGRELCSPRSPSCSDCPLDDVCEHVGVHAAPESEQSPQDCGESVSSA